MIGIVIFTVIAFFIGIVLAGTNYFLNREDKRIKEITPLLPGYNCGACGLGGCNDMAQNIIKNGIDSKKCKTIKDDQHDKLKTYINDHKKK